MRVRNFAIGMAALAAGAAVALYGIDWRLGNVSAQSACSEALTVAGRLEPLARGEVAAFQAATDAKDLSGLAFQSPEGEAISLGTLTGKTRLLNIWATWCAPCREEMPALDRLEAQVGGDNFAVVPVSIDMGGPDKPKSFLQSAGVERLPLYRDPTTDIFNSLRKEGLAVGLPVSVLVDSQGCLLGHMNAPAEWDSDDAVKLVKEALRPA